MNNQNSNVDNLNNNGMGNTPLNNEINAQVNTPLNNGMNAQVNTPLNNGMNAQVNTPLNNEMNAQVNTSLNNGINAQVNTPLNNGMNAQVNTPLNNGMNAQVNIPLNNDFNNMINSKPISNNSFNNFNSKKNNKKVIMIVGAVVLLSVILIGVFVFLKPKNNNFSEDSVTEQQDFDESDIFDEDKFTSSDSFFLENDDYTYTLYDGNGQKIIEQDFKTASGFVDGVAVVENQNEEYGLIKEDGTMLLDYASDNYIYNRGAFFEVTQGNNTKIYDSKGKIILEGENIYGHELSYDNHQAAMFSDSDNIYIYNYKGDKVSTIPLGDGMFTYEAYVKDNYLSLYYNNVSYIINTNSKLLFTLDNEYTIQDVSEDGKQFLLIPYSEIYNSSNKYHYTLVLNGKIVSNFESNEFLYFENNIIKGDYNLYDKNGKVMKNGTYYDENNYILENDGKIDLYVDGKLKTTFNCEITNNKTVNKEFYLMEDCDKQNGLTYYKLDGTKLNDELFMNATDFDEYGLAIVSYDGDNYFLMDTKGEKVSDEYEEIEKVYNDKILTVTSHDNANLYIASKDGKKILIDGEGREIVSGNYISIEYKRYAAIDNDDSYEIFDIVKNKNIITLDNKPSLYKNFFTALNDGNMEYYSYGSGKPLEK